MIGRTTWNVCVARGKALLLFSIIGLAISVSADEPFQRLTRAELEKLAGTWELKTETKRGFTGFLRLHIKLVKPSLDGKVRIDDGSVRIDYQFRGPRKEEAFNTRANFVQGARQGAALSLVDVTAKSFDARNTIPPGGTPDERLDLQLEDDRLTISARPAPREVFFPQGLLRVDLPWERLVLQRVSEPALK